MDPVISKGKNWCFTCNNYTDEDEVLFQGIESKYIAYTKEIGESGTPHLQGFICFISDKRMSALKKLHPTCHWEYMRGSFSQNEKYCTKTGPFTFEKGEVPMTKQQQGLNEKERWATIRKLSEQGKFDEIDDKVYMKNPRGIHFVHEQALRKRKFETIQGELNNEWLVGESGTGKSMTARSENPDAFIKQANKWWDNYRGEEVVIMEDIDTGHEWLAYNLNQWADRYPFPAEVKGSSIGTIRPTKIVVTSRYMPDQIFKDPSTIASIDRRFKFRHFPENK